MMLTPEFSEAAQGIFLIAPILPGKAEAWRRYMQEVQASRRAEHDASRRRLGIRVERVWIHETRQGASGILYIESTQPAQTFMDWLTVDHPFERWTREQWLALHGLDFTQLVPLCLPELVLDWRAEAPPD